jgi:type IV pilus assembly protein PilE
LLKKLHGKIMKQTQSGFTLVELMIVVAIIGILASIAVPSYQESVRKSRRADAKGALMGLANAMERHFTETNSYCDAGGAGGGDSCGLAGSDFGTPAAAVYTPSSETDSYYNFTINADISPSSYTLSATPDGAQADDKCGTLTLTNTGQKDVVGAELSKADCW